MLAPRLREAIVARLGWTSLREVQELAGAALLAGHNAVVLAPTAGGKTEAALFPALSELVNDPVAAGRVGVLYLAPIRALLNNQAERLGRYTEMVGLDRTVWHGDTTETERKRFLREPTELLMTTPESLEVMLLSRRVDVRSLFADLRMVVVDEVHALAGTDRGSHLASVLERVSRLSRRDVQRVGLSATVGNPEGVLAWLQGTSARQGVVVDPPRPKVKRDVKLELCASMDDLVASAVEATQGGKSFVFCESRATAERVAEQMAAQGTTVFVHHSAVAREERQLAESKFGGDGAACIVCTSTLELGIDVGDLDRVVQIDAPSTVGGFLQRMGRTGRRAGQTPNTTFLTTESMAVLQAVAMVELAKVGWVESIVRPQRAWPVLIHQLVALSLEHDGVPPDDAWQTLSRVGDFAGIGRGEYDRLVEWLVRDEALVRVSGRLVIGPKVEKHFGRKNFREIYAVFESPQSYTVVTASSQQVVGTLEQDFVDLLVAGESAFLLAGRAWWVERVGHDERRVVVVPAPRGKEPSWGGILPRFLGFEVCQAMLAVVLGQGAVGWVSADAMAAIDDWRDSLAGVVDGRGGLVASDGSTRWWTFAGGRINQTLKMVLVALEPAWRVSADNLGVSIRRDGGSVMPAEVRALVERLADPETWEATSLWDIVAMRLPSYRLSKFQVLMPPWIVHELLAGYLIDVEGAFRAAARLVGGGQPSGKGASAALAHLTTRDVAALPQVQVHVPLANALERDVGRALVWVADGQALAQAAEVMKREPLLGFDVETTLRGHTLCLAQIAGAHTTWLIDALMIDDLSPVASVLADAEIVKLVHNAAFERTVLERHGLVLEGVVDTMSLSRQRHGVKADGGHSLKAVCARELGALLDKQAQVSDWSRRPLHPWQRDYAALDAEVLLQVYAKLATPQA